MPFTDNLARTSENGLSAGLCVECALRHHDFREILERGAVYELFSEAPLPEAWIGGRRHRLLLCDGAHETTCCECARSVPSLYIPVEHDARSATNAE